MDRLLTIEQNPIEIDKNTAQQDTNNQMQLKKNIKSPKTTPEIGIFDKISSIWMNKNENTASNDQHNKNQPDIIKRFKQLFKS